MPVTMNAAGPSPRAARRHMMPVRPRVIAQHPTVSYFRLIAVACMGGDIGIHMCTPPTRFVTHLSRRLPSVQPATWERVLSVCEDRPADRVTPSLILQNKRPDVLGQLVSLPVALTAGTEIARARCSDGPDRIGGGTKVMLGHVAHTRSLTSGIGRVPRCPGNRTGRPHRPSATCPSVHHRHIITGPRARRLDRLTRASVRRAGILEELQNVFRALGRPDRQEPMIRIGQ